MCGQISEHPHVFPYVCNPYMLYGFLRKICKNQLVCVPIFASENKSIPVWIFASENPCAENFTSENLWGNIKISTLLGTFLCRNLKFLGENGINCTWFEFVFHFFPRYEQKCFFFGGGGSEPKATLRIFSWKWCPRIVLDFCWIVLHLNNKNDQTWQSTTKLYYKKWTWKLWNFHETVQYYELMLPIAVMSRSNILHLVTLLWKAHFARWCYITVRLRFYIGWKNTLGTNALVFDTTGSSTRTMPNHTLQH